jgi:mono/diheme cytochrome c family protein
MKKTLVMTVTVVSALLAAFCLSDREASAEKTGESLFREHCSGCHAELLF